MPPNFYDNVEEEFLELSHKCSSLPNEETRAEWREKNRYSNNQPCTLLQISRYSWHHS